MWLDYLIKMVLGVPEVGDLKRDKLGKDDLGPE
jgi:hypothetical protein